MFVFEIGHQQAFVVAVTILGGDASTGFFGFECVRILHSKDHILVTLIIS